MLKWTMWALIGIVSMILFVLVIRVGFPILFHGYVDDSSIEFIWNYTLFIMGMGGFIWLVGILFIIDPNNGQSYYNYPNTYNDYSTYTPHKKPKEDPPPVLYEMGKDNPACPQKDSNSFEKSVIGNEQST